MFSAAVRFIRLFVISIISSLPIVLLAVYFNLSSDVLLIISFIIFAAAVAMDTFIFSMYYRFKQDCIFGVLIPYAVYILISVVAYFFIKPLVYNYAFLPLRGMEFFNMRSAYSIITVHIFLIVILFVFHRLGVRIGDKRQQQYEAGYGD